MPADVHPAAHIAGTTRLYGLVGDPLTMVAGVLREPLPTFLAIVTIAKVGRYLAVAWLVMH